MELQQDFETNLFRKKKNGAKPRSAFLSNRREKVIGKFAIYGTQEVTVIERSKIFLFLGNTKSTFKCVDDKAIVAYFLSEHKNLLNSSLNSLDEILIAVKEKMETVLENTKLILDKKQKLNIAREMMNTKIKLLDEYLSKTSI